MLRPYVVESPTVVQDDVGVCRHRLPEDSTLPVSRAPGLRARGRLQVVNEPLHDATFDESQRPGGHALIIQGARLDPTATQRIVGEGEPRVEHLHDECVPSRTHSSSRGRDAIRPPRRGSSVRENRGSNTCSPTFAPRGEMPWSTAFPERACVTGSISADRPAGVKTTGRAPSGAATTRSA